MADTTAPANVTNLKAINLDGAVALKWTDPEDEDLFGIQINFTPKTYAASRAVAPMESGSIFVAPGTEIAEISNLVNGTEYTFVVKPMDLSGNKSTGESVKITPEEIEGSVLAITLTPDTTAATNQDVSVSIAVTTESNRFVKTIKMATGSKELEDFETEGTEVSSSFTVSENGIYTVYAQDIDGRVGLKKIVVSNIDKTAPGTVKKLSGIYSSSNKKITLSWTEPLDTDFKKVVISYTKNGVAQTPVEKNKGTTVLELNDIEAGLEFVFTVTAYDNVGNAGAETEFTLVTVAGPKINSVILDRNHLSGTESNRTVNVTILGSNFDKIAEQSDQTVKVQVLNSSGSAESTTTATIYVEENKATAAVTIPTVSSATATGTDFTIRIKLCGTNDTENIKTVNVSADYTITSVSVAESQIAAADVNDDTKVHVTIKGTNLDLAKNAVIKLYDSLHIEYTASTTNITDSETLHAKSLEADVKVPNVEGIYKLKVIVGETENTQTASLQVYGVPQFTSFNIPMAGISKEDGSVTATVRGKNFMAPDVKASDFSVSCNERSPIVADSVITIKDDTKLTVTLTIPETAGNFDVMIGSGENSLNSIFVVKDYGSIAIGDYILKDGTTLSKDTELTDSQKEKIVAVAGCFDIYGAMCGLGLNQSILKLITNVSSSISYDGIKADISFNPTTITGDTYGSDNWEYLKTVDPENTEKAESEYPAFYFALNYGTTSGLEGDLANGWFIPSIYELYELSKNITTINDLLYKVNGKKLTSSYSSSSKDDSFRTAYYIYIDSGNISSGSCDYARGVLCIRVF